MCKQRCVLGILYGEQTVRVIVIHLLNEASDMGRYVK